MSGHEVEGVPDAVVERLVEALDQRQVRQGLFLIRLPDVDLADRFHRELIGALAWCDPAAMDGDLITAMQAATVHAMGRVGEQLSAAKAGAETMMELGTAEHRASGASKAAAVDLVKADPDYWALKSEADRLVYVERYMRKVLELMQSLLDNHRTTRADQRAADRWHSETAT